MKYKPTVTFINVDKGDKCYEQRK